MQGETRTSCFDQRPGDFRSSARSPQTCPAVFWRRPSRWTIVPLQKQGLCSLAPSGEVQLPWGHTSSPWQISGGPAWITRRSLGVALSCQQSKLQPFPSSPEELRARPRPSRGGGATTRACASSLSTSSPSRCPAHPTKHWPDPAHHGGAAFTLAPVRSPEADRQAPRFCLHTGWSSWKVRLFGFKVSFLSWGFFSRSALEFRESSTGRPQLAS